ncbi:hypothetical protein HanRHA438_Chr04g0156681 [Helianthus annuus]|nr:hypothetical protein HanRHA438_Chr04g0156681 [Helianthus annuus]
MLFLTFRVDQDVVYKHDHKLVEVGFAYSVHEIHEYRRRVGHPKGHNEEFIMTITSSECSFGDVFITDP